MGLRSRIKPDSTESPESMSGLLRSPIGSPSGFVYVGLVLLGIEEPVQPRPVLHVLAHLRLYHGQGSEGERNSTTKSGHRVNSISELRSLVSPPVGTITSRPPSALRSIR